MKKVIVIGCPGSGKSTFSKALSKITGLPLVHLDMLFWNADKTTVAKDVFLDRVTEAMRKEEWIIDGNYASSLEMRIKECDTVFFLDYSLDVCLDGIRERRGEPRDDMPWIETEDDPEFIDFVKSFETKSRPHIIEILNKFSDRNINVFKKRYDADKYLKQLCDFGFDK